MSRVSERELVQLGPWPLGANNLARETSVPRASFREGVNVDVGDDGKVSRRDGATLVYEAAEAHSVFGYGNRGFFVHGTTLYAFEVYNAGATSEPLAIAEGFAMDAPLAHTLVTSDIYVSDGRIALRIAPDNSTTPWSLELPPAPTLTAGEGSLEAGRYHFAVAAKLPDGSESALSYAATIELSEPGSIAVALPPLDPTATRCAIYMTKPNGTEFLLLGVVPANAPPINVLKQALGRRPVTEDCDPMPAGNYAATWNGRLLVASENQVDWSEPMHYSVTKAAHNYAAFPENVTMLAAVDTSPGFFVGLEGSTFFLRGNDPADTSMVLAYPAGAVPGTLAYVPGARLPMENPPSQIVPVWMASNGVFCVGMVDGTVLPLSETRYAARTGAQGAAAFVQREGSSRYVATVRNPDDNVFGVTDSISAEVTPPT